MVVQDSSEPQCRTHAGKMSKFLFGVIVGSAVGIVVARKTGNDWRICAVS